jgi:hypothetical protein
MGVKFKKDIDGDRRVKVADNEGDTLRVWANLDTGYFLTLCVNMQSSAGLTRKQAIKLAKAILKEAMRDAAR